MPEGFPLWISVWPTATEEAQLQSFLSPSLNPVMQSFSFPDHTHSHALPQGVTAHLRASLTNHRSNPAFWNICSLLWFSLFPLPRIKSDSWRMLWNKQEYRHKVRERVRVGQSNVCCQWPQKSWVLIATGTAAIPVLFLVMASHCVCEMNVKL